MKCALFLTHKWPTLLGQLCGAHCYLGHPTWWTSRYKSAPWTSWDVLFPLDAILSGGKNSPHALERFPPTCAPAAPSLANHQFVFRARAPWWRQREKRCLLFAETHAHNATNRSHCACVLSPSDTVEQIRGRFKASQRSEAEQESVETALVLLVALGQGWKRHSGSVTGCCDNVKPEGVAAKDSNSFQRESSAHAYSDFTCQSEGGAFLDAPAWKEGEVTMETKPLGWEAKDDDEEGDQYVVQQLLVCVLRMCVRVYAYISICRLCACIHAAGYVCTGGCVTCLSPKRGAKESLSLPVTRMG